jgi:hypothetical protein
MLPTLRPRRSVSPRRLQPPAHPATRFSPRRQNRRYTAAPAIRRSKTDQESAGQDAPITLDAMRHLKRWTEAAGSPMVHCSAVP